MDRWVCLSKRHDIWTVIDEKWWSFVCQWQWNYAKAGTIDKIYAKRNVGKARTPVLLHRALLFHINPLPTHMQGRNSRGRPLFVADHEDGNSLNNREENLRWLSKAEDVSNSWNTRQYREGKLLQSKARQRALEALGLQLPLELPDVQQLSFPSKVLIHGLQSISGSSEQGSKDVSGLQTFSEARARDSQTVRWRADACKRLAAAEGRRSG